MGQHRMLWVSPPNRNNFHGRCPAWSTNESRGSAAKFSKSVLAILRPNLLDLGLPFKTAAFWNQVEPAWPGCCVTLTSALIWRPSYGVSDPPTLLSSCQSA
jgi:hypothetical protein